MMNIVFDHVENMVETEENVGYQYFHLFPTMTVLKEGISLVVVNPLPDDKILDWSKKEQIADNILRCI